MVIYNTKVVPEVVRRTLANPKVTLLINKIDRTKITLGFSAL